MQTTRASGANTFVAVAVLEALRRAGTPATTAYAGADGAAWTAVCPVCRGELRVAHTGDARYTTATCAEGCRHGAVRGAIERHLQPPTLDDLRRRSAA